MDQRPWAADSKALKVCLPFGSFAVLIKKSALLPYRIFPIDLHKPIAPVTPHFLKIKKPYSFEYSSLCLDYSPTG